MSEWDINFKLELLKVPNYREFIKLFFNRPANTVNPKKVSYSEFARRCNIASKSYVHDITAGRKRLTPNSFEKVAQGLKLNSIWTEYFKCLTALEENDFRSPRKSLQHFCERIEKLKLQIQKRLSTHQISPEEIKAQDIFLSDGFPEVYASLGEPGVGATFSTVLKRSGLPEKSLKQALLNFESLGLLKLNIKTGYYVPSVVSVESYGLKSSEIFRRDYFASIEKAKLRFQKQASTNGSLFMTQTFSVKSKCLNDFRQQLAVLVENFSIQAESGDGDCLAEICLSFTNNK